MALNHLDKAHRNNPSSSALQKNRIGTETYADGVHRYFLVVSNQPRRRGDLDLLLLVATSTPPFKT
jgi:hypothetical protein